MSRTHSKWVNGRLIFYEHGNRQRWTDAIGADVVKWEMLNPEPQSGTALMRYTSVTDSTGTVQKHTTNPYIVRADTHAAVNKSAAIQCRAVTFKLEASMPLYFGVEHDLANASSVGLNIGLFQAKSADLLTSSGVVQTSTGGVYFISATGAKTLTPTTATASGAATSTTSTTSIKTTDQILEFTWDGSTTLTFYASGAELGTLTSSICSSLALAPGFTIQGNNKQMDFKWARCIQLRT